MLDLNLIGALLISGGATHPIYLPVSDYICDEDKGIVYHVETLEYLPTAECFYVGVLSKD